MKPEGVQCADCGHDREQHDDADGQGCAGIAYWDPQTGSFERCHCFTPPPFDKGSPSFDMWALNRERCPAWGGREHGQDAIKYMGKTMWYHHPDCWCWSRYPR